MNTPTHIAASLLVWRHEPGWLGMGAVTLGAALPDLPMFGFYAYQKIIGSTEQQIWGALYFEPQWQLFFDLFNSIPIAMLLMGICFYIRQPLGIMLAASALLHMICDLPVHHDDAHRHFLPFPWRFESPISYWDSAHFGHIVAPLEMAFGFAASCWVSVRANHKVMRVAGRVNLSLYLIAFAMIAFWVMRLGK